jgi:hypothetical protein
MGPQQLNVERKEEDEKKGEEEEEEAGHPLLLVLPLPDPFLAVAC